MSDGGDEKGFLSARQVAAYGRFDGAPSGEELERYHLRDQNGDHEVDLIAELDAHRLVAIEIKATAAPRLDSARHLIWLRDQLGERFVAGVVLHTGPRVFPLGNRIIAAPMATLWG